MKMNKLIVVVITGLILVCSPTGWATPWTPPTEGLVGYWSFDNQSDLGHDDSGNGNDGSLVGGVSWTTGVMGGAVHLDGTGYISVPDSDSLDLPGGEGTIAAFIKIDPSSSGFGIVSKESSSSYPSTIAYEFLIRPTHSGKMVEYCLISDGTSYDFIGNDDGECLKDSLWHHIALTWSGLGGELILYRDEVEVIRIPQTISEINNIPEPVLIGAFRWNVPPGILRYMTGDIDEVRIYDRALVIPEPATLLVLGLGAVMVRRKRAGRTHLMISSMARATI